MKKQPYKYFYSGTLGDTFLAVLKLMKLGNVPIEVSHFTKCVYWLPQIKEIYSLLPNVKVTFVSEKREDVEQLDSSGHGLTYFPKFKIKSKFKLEKPYIVIVPHSGKPSGGSNTKEVPIDFVNMLISATEHHKVLLGTDTKLYGDISDYKEPDGNIIKCTNLTGKTSIIDTIPIISESVGFIGPEGLLAFISLSQKKKSRIYYDSYKAIEHRILGTPWMKYCQLVPIPW